MRESHKPPFQVSLAAARTNAKMSQTELAKELGVSTTTVCFWETGKCDPTLAQLEKLSELSHIPLDYIFIGKSN